MRILAAFLSLLIVVCLVGLSGCSDGQESSQTAGVETPETEGEKTGDENGEKTAGGEADPEEEVDDGPIPFDRFWPNDPRAREFLLDPEDEKVVYSYWRDAQVGDWVRFMSHRQNVILYKVIKRDGDKVEFTSTEFKRTGEEIPEEKPDVRKAEITTDSQNMKGSLLNNPFVVRSIYEWNLYKSDKVLQCERRNVDNPTGDNKETCYSWDIRCGGYIFQRSGRTLVVLMLDFGDVANPPKWDHLKPAELLSYWQKFNRFLDEPFIPQEDPVEGELPEMPENPPPAATAGKLKELEALVGPQLSGILDKKSYGDAVKSLDQVKPIIENVRAYAMKNNFVPALKEIEKVSAKADELSAACGGEKDAEASRALGGLRELLDRLYIAVNYKKELK